MPTFPLRFLRAARHTCLALAILLGLYALLGFLVLPVLLQAQLPPRLALLLGREVRVQRVRLNPFTLSLTVQGFQVREADGSAFLGWDQLRVSLRLSSLVTRTVSFQSIELIHPFGRVVLEKGGRLNFSDILARLNPVPPSTTTATTSASARPRAIRIAHLSIQGARIILLDRGLREPYSTTLGPLSLDLTGFSSEPDSHSPYAFSGRTDSGESFKWQGAFSLEPLESHGSFSIGGLLLAKLQPFYRDQVAFQISDGQASAAGDYAFQWSAGSHLLRLANGSLELLNLKLVHGHGAPDLSLPRVSAQGLQADLIGRSVEIGALSLQDGRIAVTRGRDGEMALIKLLTPLPAEHPEPPEPASPFRLALKELQLKGFRVAFQDLLPVRPVQVLAEDLDLNLQGLSLDPACQANLKLALKLNGKASLAAEGSISPFRPAVDLKVRIQDLELPGFDPYLAPALDVRLNRGSLSLAGQLSGAFQQLPGDYLAYKGSLRLERLEAADGVRGEPFLGYRSLALTGLELRSNPKSVSIDRVDLVEPDQRLVLAEDGSSNVGRALKLTPPPPTTKLPLSALGAALPPSQGPELRLSIGQTQVTGGRLSFIDRSLEPNAAFIITNLAGHASSLSTQADSQSLLDFTGLAGGLSPLHIHGHAMPLRKDQDTDVSVEIQASELSDFSPYAGKFLGYTIQKGKLGLNAQVRIEQRQLRVLLQTRMNQFYLGDKVESPEATHLPVKLCLAILRDRAGVIDLELPVSGSLDDPDLHYGKIVWNAFLNVMGKVISSPFSWLAKLGGAQEHDLSFIAFAPGSAVADPVAATKLQALAKALTERPDLSLEAQGATDPGADAGALKQAALEQLLQRLATSNGAGAAPSPEQRAQCLRLAFQQAFQAAPLPGKAAAGAPVPQPPPPAEMEQRLLGTLRVSGDDLRRLADQRTKAILQLLRDAQVDPGRLFAVTGMERATQEAGSRVYFGLK